jgi:hypothetical protein
LWRLLLLFLLSGLLVALLLATLSWILLLLTRLLILLTALVLLAALGLDYSCDYLRSVIEACWALPRPMMR